MLLKMTRKWFFDDTTIGTLEYGDFKCFTLEDKVRPAGNKVFGETAIPSGEYKVVLTKSPKFGVKLPLILDVENFSGIRIHSGNTKEDTKGCILVGMEMKGTMILKSRIALGVLMEILNNTEEPISIIISNDPEEVDNAKN